MKKNSEITLFFNNVLTNDPCCLCGRRTDPTGFDFCIGKRLVCNTCIERLRPDLVDIQIEVDKYAKFVSDITTRDIQEKLKRNLAELIDKRVMSIFRNAEIPF